MISNKTFNLLFKMCTLGFTAIFSLVVCMPLAAQKNNVTDAVIFGNEASEKEHQLTELSSKATVGALNEPAREILPIDTKQWKGGQISLTIKVDPEKQNYVTAKFWGSDISHNKLILYCEGKQVGYRHLGDIDLLDIGTDFALCNNRFYYNTSPLPINLTKGKKEIKIDIQAIGPTWGYGTKFEQYQKAMEEKSRGIYNLYSHTDPYFTPSANEKQGNAVVTPPLRSEDKGVLNRLRARVNKELDKLLDSKRPLSQVQMQFVAKAYYVKWSTAYKSSLAVDQISIGLDSIYLRYHADTKLAEADPATWNADWFGLGITGQIIYLLEDKLKKSFDKDIENDNGEKIKRRDAYTEMLVYCRDWHTKHRRLYTNQSMINDLYGIYYANKGVQILTPLKATSEKEVLHYLYQSVGLEPWLGSATDTGYAKNMGDSYFETTPKGLTKELGFVGNYGEVLDWCAEIYEATRPALGKPGDQKIKEQIEKIALARMPFRYPALDALGNKAMRQETVVGWRDTHYPGDITYAQRPSWDGSPLQMAAITRNPLLLSYTKQMIDEHQFFSSVDERMEDNKFRVTAGLLQTPDEYDEIMKTAPSKAKLPMSDGQPDFVFSDEEDGVVAIKNGNEILYASLYWRARNAVNYLGRVHHITPLFDRISTLKIEEEFEPQGTQYLRPNFINFGFANGGPKYPEDIQSAHAGEKLPVAKIPAGVAYKDGQESIFAGKAQFYKMTYGDYLIAMNSTTGKTFELEIPVEFARATNLVTKAKINSVKTMKVSPGETLVLFK